MRVDAAVRQERMMIAAIEEIQEIGARIKTILGLSPLVRPQCPPSSKSKISEVF